jgi:hypothetical protein
VALFTDWQVVCFRRLSGQFCSSPVSSFIVFLIFDFLASFANCILFSLLNPPEPAEDPAEKPTGGSHERGNYIEFRCNIDTSFIILCRNKVISFLYSDAALARVETEKKMSLIRAWEENEKTKAENKLVL